ncbi:copper chaperone PCu(A)C [Hyphococcus lacteus]|uniref:Copper chaperone PCu(A)C n=1 Tax=Hyphococcus lacteus TaxID=3143536 RepID=A0ABV3Z4E4_9PROT
MKSIAVAAFIPVLLLTGCGEKTQSPCGSDELVVSNAWVREAGQGQPMSAAYLSICNGTNTSDRLVGASFDAANTAEIHTTTIDENNVARMARMENGVPLPIGESTNLAPGSAHLMLIGLTDTIEIGSDPMITLEFENAPPITLNFEVRGRTEVGHSAH